MTVQTHCLFGLVVSLDQVLLAKYHFPAHNYDGAVSPQHGPIFLLLAHQQPITRPLNLPPKYPLTWESLSIHSHSYLRPPWREEYPDLTTCLCFYRHSHAVRTEFSLLSVAHWLSTSLPLHSLPVHFSLDPSHRPLSHLEPSYSYSSPWLTPIHPSGLSLGVYSKTHSHKIAHSSHWGWEMLLS